MNQQSHSLISERIELLELLKLAVELRLQEEFLGKWFELCNSADYVELELLFTKLYGVLEAPELYSKASDEVRALIGRYNVAFDQYVCFMQSIVAAAHQ
ncbi:MAG: hypothetical protein ACYC5G_01505 [Candidatus Doudnabacteria bacterium]